jgi:sterol desaturase/sphingolipid hydroxylase (fatty acid hydroxylase superfamily)
MVIGAVLYNPKVSVIWDIISAFFQDNGCPIDTVFYTNYELQVEALLKGHIDIAWNSPLAWLDASPEAVVAVAVVTTLWGDFNHANLDVGLGPLGYLLNSPRMHLWHHDQSSEGGVAKNFGIVFSAWDFLFGTAHWPSDRSPARLGYPGDEEMPSSLLDQLTWPLSRRRPAG